MIAGRGGTVFRRDFRLRKSGVDVVALDLDVKSRVVHSKKPSSFAGVSPGGEKGEPNRLALRLGDGPIGDLLQRRALLSRLRMTTLARSTTLATRAPMTLATRESRRP